MKKLLLVASVLALLTMSACAKGATGETYTATEKGYGGDVVVELTVSEGKITNVTITGDGETPGVGSKAIGQLRIMKWTLYQVLQLLVLLSRKLLKLL